MGDRPASTDLDPRVELHKQFRSNLRMLMDALCRIDDNSQAVDPLHQRADFILNQLTHAARAHCRLIQAANRAKYGHASWARRETGWLETNIRDAEKGGAQ